MSDDRLVAEFSAWTTNEASGQRFLLRAELFLDSKSGNFCLSLSHAPKTKGRIWYSDSFTSPNDVDEAATMFKQWRQILEGADDVVPW